MSIHTRDEDERDDGRRDFCCKALRWAVALTLGGGLLALTGGRVRDCVNAGICSTCAIEPNCDLPAAVAARTRE